MIPITLDPLFDRRVMRERTFDTYTVLFRTKDKQYHLQNVYDIRRKGMGATIDIIPPYIDAQGMKFYPIKYKDAYYDACFKPFTEQDLAIINTGNFGITIWGD